MICPECGSPTKVLDSRPKDSHKHRRRECRACYYKFSTKEYPMEVLMRFKTDYLALQNEVKRLRLTEHLKNGHKNILKEFES